MSTGAISQALVTQMNFATSVMKKQAEAQTQFIEMIAASADMTRGQNLDVVA